MPLNPQPAPGCFGFLLDLLGISPSKRQPTVEREEQLPLPYLLRDDFLTLPELSFYHVLKNVIGEDAIICPKVRLADLFFVSKPHQNYAYFNKIVSKHVDFVLCEPNTMRPLMAFELNDASHDRSDRSARDRFVKQVFDDARVPLLFVGTRHAYNTQQLATVVNRVLKPDPPETEAEDVGPVQSTSAPAVSPGGVNPPPLCPKCGVPMVVRVAVQGDYAGKKFYGCVNFPKCREMKAYPEQK